MRAPLPGRRDFRQRGTETISWAIKKRIREALAAETGTVYKDHGGRLRVCVVYPNLYSLGMANLGFQSVYRLFNDLDGCVAERAFLPGDEEAAEYEKSSTPLLSYESQTPVAAFDVVAFSVPFENDYAGVPRILELIGVPPLAAERPGDAPLVIAGGVAISLNPEPLAELVDAFLIGEAEGAVAPLVERVSGSAGAPREELLGALDGLGFVYVPSFYDFGYEGAAVTEIRPRRGAKERVRAARSYDLDRFALPESVITTPETEFRDTFLVEIERGCGRGCRFCAAGFLYMPPRWREAGRVREAVARGAGRSGKVGLVGAAVSEYPEIKGVVEYAVELGAEVTLSSLRLDVLTPELLALLRRAGYRTVTIAPEAGTARLRGVLNKGFSDGEITEAARAAAEAGFRKVKLYFLIGLPTETDADAEAIGSLALGVREAAGGGEVALSINPFVPKPFTPFQWHGFERTEVIERRFSIIKKTLAGRKGFSVSPVSVRGAYAQAYIARADRRAGAVIMDASKRGYARALASARDLVEPSVHRVIPAGEPLPWDLIDHGIRKDYLWREYQRGLAGRTTPPCDVGRCTRCGVCSPEFFKS